MKSGSAHKHILKPPRLHSALQSPLRVAFLNPKTVRDKLVRSKLREFVRGDQFETMVTKKK